MSGIHETTNWYRIYVNRQMGDRVCAVFVAFLLDACSGTTDPQDWCQQLLRCKLHLSSLQGCVSEITGIHQKLEKNEIEGLNTFKIF